jgi:hypothetical protein
MPTLLAEHNVNFDFADLWARVPISRPPSPLGRRPGVHQSGILKYIAEATGKLKPGEPLEEEMPLIFALGHAWEEYAVSFYPEIDWQPGEIVVDGIAMNCDGLLAPGMTPKGSGTCGFWKYTQLEEFKFTFKAVPEDFLTDDRFWTWQHQARGYCHGYGPRVCRWHVLHVHEAGFKKFWPVYRQYVVEWTEQEIEQTWRLLMKYRDRADKEKGQ